MTGTAAAAAATAIRSSNRPYVLVLSQEDMKLEGMLCFRVCSAL